MKTLTLIGLSALLSTGLYASEVPVDFNHCYSGDTANTIIDDDKVRVVNWELTGITVSNIEDKLFDSAATHCAGLTWNLDNSDHANAERRAYCKITLKGNEGWIANEMIYPKGGEWMWTVIGSGGKLEGATGSGKLPNLAFHAPGPKGGGTFLGCSHYTGIVTTK